ncbi:L-histidine N(alpha)-methyltransferase [Hyphomicrobium sp. LHD-15]|uniref:L-histidine N(alpha)-methyltransferase n=1 Tax=Hyphomicrobium sp. LHD-15 TaxID=3072142 RepID=UPI00280EFA44|nr:L-histidine N(alpha)-methyltransferase [Hyphomicrobium sp. LHD-15]MDQ8699460.1 L-histidine N(alpha)-methyltransferase [Hyphomicrobium sp. LHD-15]
MLSNSQTKRLRADATGQRDAFVRAVVDGLSRPQKSLPCRYFYDARGSALFEKITELAEYYPTRTETGILTTYAREMMDGTSSDSVLVEFGSGSSRKTELLLRELPDHAAYVPIDVSTDALAAATARIARRFPRLDIRPMLGDFSELSRLPNDFKTRQKIGFFPGSTIGNLAPAEASRLLLRFKSLLSAEGRLLIGIDLKKDKATLESAYNDSLGVTADFNLNLLAHINREIEPVFDLESFRHAAHYNAREGRIEMHLVSRRDQRFEISGHRFTMRAGESIHTENSYKYSVEQFQTLARCSGWTPVRVWEDSEALFSVHELA